jgi:hypothetical protein
VKNGGVTHIEQNWLDMRRKFAYINKLVVIITAQYK